MTWLKARLVAKKTWLWAKKCWWAIILGLGVLIAILIWLLTKNGVFVASLLDVLEVKRNAHDQEMETLAHIHNTEVTEKNERLKEHARRMIELEAEFSKRGETLDKEKEATLKRIIEESYNNPEKLARELAAAFGLEHG